MNMWTPEADLERKHAQAPPAFWRDRHSNQTAATQGPSPQFGLKDSWWFCFFLTHVLYRERHIFQLPLITYEACVRIIIVIRAKMCCY